MDRQRCALLLPRDVAVDSQAMSMMADSNNYTSVRSPLLALSARLRVSRHHGSDDGTGSAARFSIFLEAWWWIARAMSMWPTRQPTIP